MLENHDFQPYLEAVDDELIMSVSTSKLYGVVQQGRIRMVFEAIEDAKRTAKSEFLW